MRKYTYIALALIASITASCDKNEIKQISNPATGARIKLIHAAPGLPAVDGFINNAKVTPVQSATITDNGRPTTILSGINFSNVTDAIQYRAVFPANNDYSVTQAGNATIKVVTSTPNPALVSPQTANPGVTVATVTQNLEQSKYYSIFVTGLPGSLTNVFIEDKFTQAPVNNKVFIRFANMIPNAAPLDVTATFTLTGGTATTVTPFTNVAYKSVTDFVAVDANVINTTSYVFQMFNTGTTTKLGGASSSLVFTPGRYYTILAKGLAADYVVNSSITLKASARPNDNVNNKIPEIYFNPPGVTFIVNK